MLLCLVCVVTAATQLDVRGCCRAALRERDDVVEFEKSLLGTAAQCADECASACIASPDLALDSGRDVPRITHGV